MATAGIKAAAYCLNFAPELALHYGGTPAQERKSKPDSEFLRALPEHSQTYEEAQAYAPNKTYIGAMSIDELEKAPAPWIDNLGTPERFGSFGEIMPEDEFLGLMDICDVFDLIWLEEGFAASVAEKLAQNPVIGEKQLARLEKGRPESDILDVVEKQHALPLYSEGKLAGCCRRAHDTDENLEAGIMLENLSCKASGVLALLHLIKNAGISPSDIDFVVECSEEAVGDAMQRGGGNMAKALAEIAECGNASGFDVRGFCAGPVASVITAASMAACGARANVAVVSGGSVPKLYMNARDHVKKDVKALENCIGSFALLITPDDGQTPVIRLDSLGKHTVGAAHRQEAMLRNAILGVAVAKALGITCPSVGVLNLDAAPQVLRALNRMAEKGYPLNLGQSVRGDGGSLLRGNDLLCGAVDVCVADTLTGNVLMKVFSAFTSGGSYETSGWGYGPSVGEGWDKVVSIVSRASGAPVIANALAYTAAAVRGRLPAVVAEEIRLAKAAGMDDELAAFSKAAAAPQDEVQAPPAVPTDEEIHGIDVLDLELAVRCLWKENIYAEAAMGCTGPVVKLAGSSLDKARAVLTASGYL